RDITGNSRLKFIRSDVWRSSELEGAAKGGVGRRKRQKKPHLAAASCSFPTGLGHRWAEMITDVASSAV
ncbi:hypothetical protein TorRG33x02_188580, partial [Trema orientale]